MANPVNISGFGAVLTLIASNTFPAGLPITQFADDADPILINEIKIADTAMGLNGDLLAWNKPVPLPFTINVVPGSADDINLQILFDANTVGLGKNSAQDVISLTLIYPNLATVVFTGGIITDGAAGRGIQSSGRQKTKSYSFMMSKKA